VKLEVVMDRKEKKEALKISYLMNVIFVVMIIVIWHFELPDILWKIAFALGFINSIVCGYLFLDLVTDK
jgi:uncharacterized membrane protein